MGDQGWYGVCAGGAVAEITANGSSALYLDAPDE